jgi:hypothetical protein
MSASTAAVSWSAPSDSATYRRTSMSASSSAPIRAVTRSLVGPCSVGPCADGSARSGPIAANGTAVSTTATITKKTPAGVRPLRFTPGSRIARSRPSNSVRRAIGSAATGVHERPAVRTISIRCPAYSEGAVPARRTRSSQARSLSERSRRAPSQTSGLNQWTAQATCDRRCAVMSPRLKCASSCNSTA